MRKLVLFMHISLDGFTAKPNGEMDWIQVSDEMFELANQQTDRSDTALYGHGTYKIMQSYWPTAADKPNATQHDVTHSKWYNQVEKIVVSRKLQASELVNARLIAENVVSEVKNLKEKSGKEIVLFGSPTLSHSLIEANMVDNYWLFVNPIILGSGIPLFHGISREIKLKLLLSKTFASGVICLHYERI